MHVLTQCGHTVHSVHMHTLTPYVTVCEWQCLCNTVTTCLFFIVHKLVHCLFCLLVGVGSRPSSWVQVTGAGTFFSLHCSGWSLEDLFGRTVTTQCHLADQSNVWVYQEVSCSALECENSCSMYQGE